MARFDYTGVQGTAARLIERFGQPAILRKTAPDTSSPAYAPKQSRTDSSVEVVSIDEAERDERGSLTGRQIRKMMMAVKSGVPAPATGDEVVLNSGQANERTERIASVSPLQPGGTVVFYSLMLEG